VRFVDNFSAGNRGSASAEYFLDHGYAVLFLFRIKSLEPFKRHFVTGNFLDHLVPRSDDGNPSIEISAESVNLVLPVLTKYQKVKSESGLLSIPFTTVDEYLWLLRAASESLCPMGANALLYLAAAVSDFYLPPKEMSTHKIESTGPLNIHLKLVPKMLRPLTKHWVRNAYIVSFKLETNEAVLIPKAREALKKYEHEIVVGNILHTRRTNVVMVTSTSTESIEIPSDSEVEIEEKIVAYLVERHTAFIEKSKSAEVSSASTT